MKRPDRKIVLAMALSLAAGAMTGQAKLAHPQGEGFAAAKHSTGERVMLVLKKLLFGGS